MTRRNTVHKTSARIPSDREALRREVIDRMAAAKFAGDAQRNAERNRKYIGGYTKEQIAARREADRRQYEAEHLLLPRYMPHPDETAGSRFVQNYFSGEYKGNGWKGFNDAVGVIGELGMGLKSKGERGSVQVGRYVSGGPGVRGRSPLLGSSEVFDPVRTISADDVSIPKDIARTIGKGAVIGARLGASAAGADVVARVLTTMDKWAVPLFAAYKMGGDHRASVERILSGSENPNVRENVAELMGEMEKRLRGPNEGSAVARWLSEHKGTSIPEALADIELALRTARSAKGVDLNKESPETVLQKYYTGRKVSLNYRNPDKVKEFTGRHVVSEDLGIVAYDVPDTPEARVACREIINFHRGVRSNPWCVLTSDGKGELTKDAIRHWKTYDAVPRQIFFQNGELLAFRATAREGIGYQEYWDISDRGWPKIPVKVPWNPGEETLSKARTVLEGKAKLVDPYKLKMLDPETGELAPPPRHAAEILFGRNDKEGVSGELVEGRDGSIILNSVTVRSPGGKLKTTHYSEDGSVLRVEDEQILTTRYLREHGFDPDTDEGQRVIAKAFPKATADWANPVAKYATAKTFFSGGAETHRYEYDGRGRILGEWWPRSGHEGLVQTKKNVYDDRGNLTEKHERVPGEGLVQTYKGVYDDRGNLTEQHEWIPGEGLVPMFRNVYDDRGNLTEKHERLPGEGLVQTLRNVYDDRGNLTEKHKWLPGEGLVQTLRNVYDDRGNLTEKHERLPGEGLVPMFRNVYDDRGNLTEKHERLPGEGLVQMYKVVYDGRGNMTERLERVPGEGLVPMFRNVYDDRGNLTEEYGRVPGEGLVQTLRNVYDDRGNLTGEYIRSNGEWLQTRKEVYDDLGRHTESYYFDPDGWDLFPSWRASYDNSDRLTEMRVYEDGSTGTWSRVYDDSNRSVKELFQRDLMYPEVVGETVYDDRGREIEWRVPNANGELIPIQKTIYGDDGTSSKEVYGLVNGSPAPVSRKTYGPDGTELVDYRDLGFGPEISPPSEGFTRFDQIPRSEHGLHGNDHPYDAISYAVSPVDGRMIPILPPPPAEIPIPDDPPEYEDIPFDLKGGQAVHGAEKAGSAPGNLSRMASFLATDEVPETIFGIPIVTKETGYTKKDLEFFREHPEAGGYYDLGETDAPEPEGLPVPHANSGGGESGGTTPVVVASSNEDYDKYQTVDDLTNEIAGGSGRQWAQKEGHETKLDLKKVNGHWYVYPTKDSKGNYDAGGYRYYMEDGTGKMVAHTNGNRMTLHKWRTSADEFDKELTESVDKVLNRTFGLNPSKVPAVIKDTLWDLGFVQGPHGLKSLMSEAGSKNLHRMFTRLKAGGMEPVPALRAALAYEVDTYHRGNGRRRMDRFDRLVKGWDDVFSNVRPVSGMATADENLLATHDLRVKAFRKRLDDLATRLESMKNVSPDTTKNGGRK